MQIKKRKNKIKREKSRGRVFCEGDKNVPFTKTRINECSEKVRSLELIRINEYKKK